MFWQTEEIHFIGIGGSGMSGIAELLLNLGFKVTGSDISRSTVVNRLKEMGARIFIGHKRENIKKCDVVVYSSAVNEKNLEIREARKKGIPVIPRAEMLAELMRLKSGIAVGGTHGKTTTTSLIGSILTAGRLKPTLIIGGKFFNIGSNSKLGNGKYLVCEADESDASFLRLSPLISVVTNIDNDHLDFYGSFKNLRASFLNFIDKVPFYGFSVVCGEDKNIQYLIKNTEKRIYTYGFKNKFDICATDIKLRYPGYCFKVNYNGKSIGKYEISISGKHNLLNSLAAMLVALKLEISTDKIRKGLLSFKGVERRFELKGTFRDVNIYDDYAHHPTEISATVEAMKVQTKNELVVIFQPHRYTRTSLLYNEFGKCFSKADKLILLDIYPAGEKPIQGVSSSLIFTSLKKNGCRNCNYIRVNEKAVKEAVSNIMPGDTIVTLGAGNVHMLCEDILSKVKEKLRSYKTLKQTKK